MSDTAAVRFGLLLLTLTLTLTLAACGPKGPIEPITLDADSEWLNEPPPDPGPAAPVAAVICGEIRLSGEVAASQPGSGWNGGWILLFASRGSAGGPVLAGIKAKLPSKFPVPFCLSQKHVLVRGARLEGSLFLSARIDGDGQPELDPGDFDGATRTAVPVGTRNAIVVIDTVR